MWSPILAMLWENWRLTRREASQRLSLGIVGGSALLAWPDGGVTYAFWLLLSQFAFFWFSISKLNGGSFLDGYKPGFPLQLLYTRPAPTAVFVGVAMAYDAVSCAALYLASAALLWLAFGQPLSLLPVAGWIVAFHLISTCIQWSTRNRVVQWVGSFVICMPFFVLLVNRVEPTQVEFSLAEYALMASLSFVSFGLTVGGVARQRRGDAVATVPRKPGSAADTDWLVNLIPIPCPTSSATRAQVWFDLKSSGVGVLAIGVALAIVNPLLFAAGIAVAYFRPLAIFCAMLSGLVVLILGGNAFGIRRRQGHRYASAFSATQSYGTAWLAGVKVLVRSVCVLTALVAVVWSAWASSSLVSEWDYAAGEPVYSAPAGLPASDVDGQRWVRGIQRVRGAIGDAIGGLTGYQLGALALVMFIGIAVMVALRSSIEALRASHRRQVTIAGALILLYCLALVLLAVAAQFGSGPGVFVNAANAAFFATPWLIAVALMLVTIHLFRSVFAERILSLRHGGGAVVIASAFGVAWVTVLRATGLPLAALPAGVAVWLLTPALLTLMASVLAPWSLSRVRHT